MDAADRSGYLLSEFLERVTSWELPLYLARSRLEARERERAEK